MTKKQHPHAFEPNTMADYVSCNPAKMKIVTNPEINYIQDLPSYLIL